MSDPAATGHAETQARLDPDALARLEEERDHLLASIEDLDAEHAAGDLTDDEHRLLRDEYTARAAEIIRALSEHHAVVARDAPPRRPGRVAVAVVGVVVVAGLAGWALAGALGARGAGTGLTGSGATIREQLAECQRLFGQPQEAVDCYDGILDEQPDQLEALTYQGWALVRGGDPDAGSERFDRVVAIDPAFPDVYVFRAVVAKDAGDFAAAQAELDTLLDLDPPASLLDTVSSMGLDVEVALGLLDPRVAECWTAVARFGSELQRSGTTVPEGETPEGAEEVLACFDAIPSADPAADEAATYRAAAVYGLGIVDQYASSVAALDRVVAGDPSDATARTVRAALRLRTGDVAGTVDDVGALAEAGRPSALVGGISAALRRDLDQLIGDTTTSTTTP